MFITFEGGEGCGKSTQSKKLFTYLKERNYRVVLTREPGGTTLSDKIREILLSPENKEMTFRTEVLLYMASRAQHTEELIKPTLESGGIVICDRYIDSSFAYQGWARGLGIDNIEWLNRFATNNLVPDITIVIDVPPEIGLKRVGKNKDRIEQESIVFHNKVREGYIKLSEMYDRVKIIDGNRDIEDVFEDVKSIVLPLIDGRSL